MGKKEKKAVNNKPATEKKERKQRVKMRSRKESPAGHFADRLRANRKQFDDIMRAINGFPGVSGGNDDATNLVALETLAAEGYVPPRRNAGRKAVTFAPGQQVALAPEALAMLRTLFTAANIDESKFFVSNGYTPQPKDTQLPLRIGSGDLDAPTVGFVSRKWIQNAAPVA